MDRRGFFGRLSAIFAFFGIGSASGDAAAADRPALEMRWIPNLCTEPDETWPDGASDRVIETLEIVHQDWHATGRITHMQRRFDSFYRFDAEVGWSDPEPPSDAHRVSSWGHDLDEVRARAELAILLMLDVKRVENEAIGSRWRGFRLLSSR